MSPEEANKIIEQASNDLIQLSSEMRDSSVLHSVTPAIVGKMTIIARNLDKIDATELSFCNCNNKSTSPCIIEGHQK